MTPDAPFAFDLFAGTFTRGEGGYFHLGKLAVVIAVFLGWVKAVTWVDQDSIAVGLPRRLWNLFVLATGVLGLMFMWLFPIFLVGLILLLTLVAGPLGFYVHARNQVVSAGQRVFTGRHLEKVMSKNLGMKVKVGGDGKDDDTDSSSRVGDVPMVRFVGKSQVSGEDDETAAARAQQSKGYKSAQRLIIDALNERATDIHMEPSREEMTVRFRIDSMLTPTEPFSRARGESVLNIFKVLGNLDITEKRKPQDGSFSAVVSGRQIDFRVATAGSVNGEKMVLRILDRSKQVSSLTDLGMRESLLEQIRTIADLPHGMLIACGPTGAGKSSTLYACLAEIDRFVKNVITLENPVEYQLENITQIEINPKAGKTFATELRSILRQDPDVILVGEIRDAETAEIACQAAQTGHMVFTTLHANDTVTAVGRLIDLGVQPFQIANALTAVLGQRLVRLLCPKCRIKYQPTAAELAPFGLTTEKVKALYRAPGTGDETYNERGEVAACPHCKGTGYRGRSGIFELLVINDSIRELIRSNPSAVAIKEEAVKNGLVFLHNDGLKRVLEGKTSLSELQRVAK